MQWLVLIGSALLLLLFLSAWIFEGRSKQWKSIQKEYEAILQEEAKGNPGAGAPFEKGIFQIELPQLGRSDRCISCHHGLVTERSEPLPQPHTQHPGNFLTDHPSDQYGCTICHGGQPGALSRREAFGRGEDVHWSHPLMDQPYIQASCGQCHLALYTSSSPSGESQAGKLMEGMEVLLEGKEIFSREGCLGCHQARGVGGILGPDLTEQGEKTRHEYSFQNIRGEQTVSNWIKEHFRDPEMVSPGSQMLKIELDESEMTSLATFVMGLAKPDIPIEYFSMEALKEFKGERDLIKGDKSYDYLCSACHGKQGEGKDYDDYKTGIPSIGNADFLRVASEDYIRFTLEKGRSERQMSSWAGSISGMKAGELDQVASFVKMRKTLPDRHAISAANGTLELGEQVYKDRCLTCHGEHGRGDVAVTLKQEGLLSRADEDFLLTTLVNGRGNTGMPGWWTLEEEELSGLLRMFMSWRTRALNTSPLHLPQADLEEGERSYHFLCFRCHGEFGEGHTGPAIINKDFLHAASDRFLYETIAKGRVHTAMFGWTTDVYNDEQLDLQEISNLIGFMRASSETGTTYLHAGSNPGRKDRGKDLFAKHCAECHGDDAEGKKAPALANQEFLSSATNGYLLATITLGRADTNMPAWGYGSAEHRQLKGEEREDLVAFLRSIQRIKIKY